MKNCKLMLTERLAARAKPAGKEYCLHDVTLQGFALRVQPSFMGKSPAFFVQQRFKFAMSLQDSLC